MNLPNRPLIGITTYAKNEQDEVTLPVDYVDAVRRAGGVPLLIAPGESHVSELLACIDGLILAGGGATLHRLVTVGRSTLKFIWSIMIVIAPSCNWPKW